MEPSCSQCLRGQRLCEGYPKRSNAGFTLAMNPTTSINLFKSDREQRCFDFFRRTTVPQLCGSFETPFWTHLLLLATHHEPAIRQASIALGALHECFEYPNSDTAEINLNFALQQYIRAIGSVTKPTREGGKLATDVALMTCVLFICFEVRLFSLHRNSYLFHRRLSEETIPRQYHTSTAASRLSRNSNHPMEPKALSISQTIHTYHCLYSIKYLHASIPRSAR